MAFCLLAQGVDAFPSVGKLSSQPNLTVDGDLASPCHQAILGAFLRMESFFRGVVEVIRRLKSTVFSSILIVLLFANHLLRADLVLSVDFDLTQAGIQSNAIVDSNGQTTASIVLFLTGTSTMYAYTFSVRYNTDRLTLNNKNDTPPLVGGKTFIEVLTDEHSVSGSGGGFVHYNEINRFDGKIDNNIDEISAADIPPEGVVLGQLTFTVNGIGDDLLVLPGEFEPFQPGQDVKPFDVFLGTDLGIRSFQGGNILAVPEPSSMLLLATVGMMWAIRRRLCDRIRQT